MYLLTLSLFITHYDISCISTASSSSSFNAIAFVCLRNEWRKQFSVLRLSQSTKKHKLWLIPRNKIHLLGLFWEKFHPKGFLLGKNSKFDELLFFFSVNKNTNTTCTRFSCVCWIFFKYLLFAYVSRLNEIFYLEYNFRMNDCHVKSYVSKQPTFRNRIDTYTTKYALFWILSMQLIVCFILNEK